MPQSIIPKRLTPGSTIAFLSPSERLNNILPTPHARGAAYFESLGYKVKTIFDSTPTTSFRSETLKRVQELHNAFLDPEIKAIVTTVGGTTANELLRHINYEIIKENPKIFIGYSDITILHYAIFAKTGLQTFYGPCALSEFAEFPKPDPFTTEHFFDILTGEGVGKVPRSLNFAPDLLPFVYEDEATESIRSLEPSPEWKWLRKGQATGRIMGGCITSLLRLSGTPYWPSHRGCILFIENPMGFKAEEALPLERTRWYLGDLVNTGIFGEISGLIVGRPYQYDEQMREELGKIVLDQVGEWDWPVLMNVDIGHTSPMLTIPLNVMASLDSSEDEFRILDAAVL